MLLSICLIIISCLCPLKAFNHRIDDIVCPEIPTDVLEFLLGAAYNPRYMSIEKPLFSNDNLQRPSMKRKAVLYDDFYVDKDFYDVVDNRPVWDIDNHVKLSNHQHRFKRSVYNQTLIRRRRDDEHYQKVERDLKREWHCKSKIDWIDLGIDYFPRYLRSVQCLSDKCWFGLYRCKPRSFTVKILRRRRGRCVKAAKTVKIGTVGLPEELRELWVWEERAVNFCCDCSR